MKVSVFRDATYFSEWLRSFEKKGIRYDLLSFADMQRVPSSDTSAVVFCRQNGFQLRNSISQVLLNCRNLGIPSYPNLRSHLLYNDKVTQSTEFRRLGIPAPSTEVFMDEGEALKWADSAELPFVSKTSSGAGSGGVLLVKSRSHARRIIRKAFSRGRRVDSYPPETSFPLLRAWLRWLVSESRFSSLKVCSEIANKHSTLRSTPFRERDFVLFQQFLPDNSFDYRVTVIGDKAFAMRRFNRDHDFRASGSDIQDMNPEVIPAEVIRTAFHAADALGMTSVMAADILMDVSSPKVVEVSYLFANHLKEYPGYFDRSLNWHSQTCTRFETLTEMFIREVEESSSRCR